MVFALLDSTPQNKLMVTKEGVSRHPLYHVRKKVLGMTQEEFADTLGVSSAYIGQIERGCKRLNEDLIQKIWQSFKIPASELLGQTALPEYNQPQRKLMSVVRDLTPTDQEFLAEMAESLKKKKAAEKVD